MARKGSFTKAQYAQAKRELGYKGRMTRAQAQRTFKRAIKIGKGEKTYKSRKPKTDTRRRRRVARRKTKRRRKFTIPLLPIIGIAAGLVKPAQMAVDGNVEGAMHVLTMNYTGWDWAANKWDIKHLTKGWAPMIMGFIGHWIASKLGINRTLGRAGVPVIRV